MQSSTATSSASVELRVLSFCFRDKDTTAPRPMVVDIPVWDFMSGCTAKATSMLHVMVFEKFPFSQLGITSKDHYDEGQTVSMTCGKKSNFPAGYVDL